MIVTNITQEEYKRQRNKAYALRRAGFITHKEMLRICDAVDARTVWE